jgi:hypothetical protein
MIEITAVQDTQMHFVNIATTQPLSPKKTNLRCPQKHNPYIFAMHMMHVNHLRIIPLHTLQLLSWIFKNLELSICVLVQTHKPTHDCSIKVHLTGQVGFK